MICLKDVANYWFHCDWDNLHPLLFLFSVVRVLLGIYRLDHTANSQNHDNQDFFKCGGSRCRSLISQPLLELTVRCLILGKEIVPFSPFLDGFIRFILRSSHCESGREKA
jgi:hypothetical protein